MPSVVIVGAGVFGAGLADRLARSGWDVTLVEQHEPGDPRASSGGESRLIRCSHGTETFYVESARRAATLWRELDPSLLVECGVAWLARRSDGWEADSERALRSAGIPAERLEPGEAASLFPSIAVDDLAFVLLEPEAGVLRARDGVRALAARATEAGTRIVRGRAVPDAGGAPLLDGRLLEADHVVWACGAWLGALFPELVSIRATRQEVLFFAAPPEWRTPPVPGWVDYDGAFYGHGDLDGLGVKACPDTEGPPIDLDQEARQPTAGPAAAAAEYLARRFPGLAGAAPRGASICQYELTGDTHFLVAPHPEHPHVWLYGGGSGHGFKHGPALAERMEAWLTGAAPPEPRFGLHERVADRSLRTAGS